MAEGGKIETETPLVAVYGVTCLLLCYTLISVGERGTGVMSLLLCGVVFSTVVTSLDVGSLASVFKGLAPNASCAVIAILTIGASIAWLAYKKREKTRNSGYEPPSLEELEKRASTPRRRSIQAQPSFLRIDWSSLPDDVMGLILKGLSQEDVREVRLVCNGWYGAATRSQETLRPREFHPEELAQGFQFLQQLDLSSCIEEVNAGGVSYLQLLRNLSDLNLGRHHRLIASSITDECVMNLRSLNRLHTLNLSQCVHVSDEGLRVLATHHPNLTSVNISGCVAVTDEGLEQLSRLKDLTYLEIPWCLKVTDGGLFALSNLSKLKHLNLSGCQLITDQGISSLSSFTDLETLNLLNTGYSKVCVTDDVLMHLRDLHQLTDLSIGWVQLRTTRVTDEGLKMIASHYPKLRNLCLIWLDVGDEGVIALTKLTDLRVLNLRGCSRVTGESVKHISNLPLLEDLNLLYTPSLDITDELTEDLSALNNLSHLGLGDMHLGNLLTDDGMANLANLSNLKNLCLAFFRWQFAGTGMGPLLKLRALESVDLQGSNCVNDSTLQVIGQIPLIKTLQLSRCAKITGMGMKYLRPLQQLQSLSLSECHKIDNNGLASIGEIPSLTSLVLSVCHQITDTGIASLNKLTNLKSLDVAGCDMVVGMGFSAFKDVPVSTLSLSGCSALMDQGLAAVGQLKSLTKLDMCECVNVSDVGLANALSGLHQLTGLDVASCYKVGDMSLGVMAKLPRLTTLRLIGCVATTNNGIAQLTQLTSLLTVHLDRCYNLTDQALHSLGKCTQLTSLRLSKCPHISDFGVAYLSSLKRLSIVSLSLCPHVTEAGLIALAKLTALASLEY